MIHNNTYTKINTKIFMVGILVFMFATTTYASQDVTTGRLDTTSETQIAEDIATSTTEEVEIAIGNPDVKQGTKKPSSGISDSGTRTTPNDEPGSGEDVDEDANLKQLAEQLVNLTVKEVKERRDNRDEDDTVSAPDDQNIQRAIREGGRTVGAGQVAKDVDKKSQKTDAKKALDAFQGARTSGPADDIDGDGLSDGSEEDYGNANTAGEGGPLGSFITQFLSEDVDVVEDQFGPTTTPAIEKEVWISAKENKEIVIPNAPQLQAREIKINEDNSIAVKAVEEGRLFGMFSWELPVEVRLDQGGELLELQKPWYAFLLW